MAVDELWQAAADVPGEGVTVAFLAHGVDGRLVLSISDADAVELGLPLTGAQVLELHQVLGEQLGLG